MRKRVSRLPLFALTLALLGCQPERATTHGIESPVTTPSALLPPAGSSVGFEGAESTPPAMSFEEAWAWLRAELREETANIRTEETAERIEKLLAWAGPNETITVFDRACRPLQLARNDRTLDGDIHVKTTVRGRTKIVSGESIKFGYDVTVVCGFDNEYERGSSGAWEQTGSSASGCASTVQHHLSEVTDTEAWYGGAGVELSVKCGFRNEQAQRCLDGSERTCSRCERLALETESGEGHFRTSSAVAVIRIPASSEAVDCAVPCPSDERSTKLAAVNAALRKGSLEQSGLEKHPTLFKTRAACFAYRKHHPISATEVDVW